jgi:hypothetical protein
MIEEGKERDEIESMDFREDWGEIEESKETSE